VRKVSRLGFWFVDSGGGTLATLSAIEGWEEGGWGPVVGGKATGAPPRAGWRCEGRRGAEGGGQGGGRWAHGG
jgi:hypothetical protein